MKKTKKMRLRRLHERRELRRQYKAEKTFRGVLSVTAGGFGFVSVPDGEFEDDILIPGKYLNDAIDQDTVEIELLPERRTDSTGRPAGRIVRVLERQRKRFVGQIQYKNHIQPMDNRLPDQIFGCGKLSGFRKNEWVEFEIEEVRDQELYAVPVRSFGQAGDLSSDLDAVIAEYGLKGPYSKAEEQAAAEIVPRPIERQDLTALCTLAIDPEDAKDYDDALSVVPDPPEGTIQVAVHISDVAAFIPEKSDFDIKAAKRGFSVYLPGRTLPMLPKNLTAKISLGGQEHSLAHTVILTIDRRTGEVLSSSRCHSFIKVAARLDYDRVQEYFDHRVAPESWQAYLEMLDQLRQTATLMRQYRRNTEKFIDLPLPEIRVKCDEENNRILGIDVHGQREAEQLVEEFMLAANSAVGQELIDRNTAGIFRIHAEPEAEKLEEFSAQTEQLFGIRTGDLSSRDVCWKFVSNLPDTPAKPLILKNLLRSLAKAKYLNSSQLHYALGKINYCHFTSPIRRYCDLTVHQQLWKLDTNGKTRSGTALERVAENCCDLEEKSDAASFAASDRVKLRYLTEQLDSGMENLFLSTVIKVGSSGVSLELAELGLYGFISNDLLYGGSFRYGAQLKGGERLWVKLVRVETVAGRGIFAPVSIDGDK